MKRWAILLLAALAAPSAAYACSCVASEDPVELRQFATDTAKSALALVEVETITAFDAKSGTGETMRVTRKIAGIAPGNFRIERGPFPSSASCDVLYEKGQKTLVVLYAPSTPMEGVYRTSGLCTSMLLDKPAFRDELARQLAMKNRTERG